MPIASFAAGTVLLFIGTRSSLYDLLPAVGLIALGLLTQMWVYARENPAKRSDKLISHLKEITEMAKDLSIQETRKFKKRKGFIANGSVLI